MRDIKKVIEEVINEIPQEQEEFIKDLLSLGMDIAYTAPENIALRWNQFAEILAEHIPTPKEDWQIKISNIFNNKTENISYAKTIILEQAKHIIKELAINVSNNEKYTKELAKAETAVHIAKSNLLAINNENKSLLTNIESIINALKELGVTKDDAAHLTNYDIPTIINKVYEQ